MTAGVDERLIKVVAVVIVAFVCVFVRLSVCVPTSLSRPRRRQDWRVSNCLSLCLPMCLYMYLSVFVSAHTDTHIQAYRHKQTLCLPLGFSSSCQSVCPSVSPNLKSDLIASDLNYSHLILSNRHARTQWSEFFCLYSSLSLCCLSVYLVRFSVCASVRSSVDDCRCITLLLRQLAFI